MRLIVVLLAAGLTSCGPGGHPELPAEQALAPAKVVVPLERTSAAPAEQPAPQKRHAVALIMDVMQVAGRIEADVSVLLGPPVTCEDIHRARLCKYGPHEDEVLFVRDKADMITVQGMDAVAFDAGALDALGLAPAVPDHADARSIRWQSIPGLVEVAMFPGPGNSVDYAYVKVGKH